MVINEKFRKMPKISLVKNRVFWRGISILGPKRYCTLGQFLVVFFHREEGCCVVRLHTEGNDVSRALRKHSKNWCFVMCHKKIEGIQKTVFGNCTSLWSLRNLPPAPQGSEAGDQTWGNFKNHSQILGKPGVRPREFFTLPSFFSRKTTIFRRFEFQIFF